MSTTETPAAPVATPDGVERTEEVAPGDAGVVDVDTSTLETRSAEGGAQEEEPERSPIRLTIAVALSTVAAAIMIGGIFEGPQPRIVASIAGVLGCGLAFLAAKIKGTAALYGTILGGLFVIALAMVVPSGIENVGSFGAEAQAAADSRGLLRPPAPWTPGWHFIVGGTMAFVGFAAAWVAIVVKRPALGLLCPLPLAAIGAISVPSEQQIASGIVALALFAVGMGVVSTATVATEDEEKPPLSYELRRAGKGLVFVAIITAALIVLAQTNFLFPKPIIDPTQEPQRPRVTPLNEAEDRVLFTVKAPFQNAQWRTGVLDVYLPEDGSWRTPPFASNRFRDVGASGALASSDRSNELAAQFAIAGLSGSVLPSLANATGVQANAPRLSYDERSGVLRIANGQVSPGIVYTQVSPNIPRVEDLRAASTQLGPEFNEFLVAPDIPGEADDLRRTATAATPEGPLPDKWSSFFFLFRYTLDELTVTGNGVPVDVTGARVQEILASEEKEASPFEIVALQALFARWIGIPSRIGYGFEKCSANAELQECRPKNGSLFVEVYFEGFGWIPVTGTPRRAKPTVGQRPEEQRIEPDVLPSDDVSINVFLPTVAQPESVATQQALIFLAILAGLLLLAYLSYLAYPLVSKVRTRSKRREAAQALGPKARVALAYCEWRDTCTDFGYPYTSDLPLMFLERFPPDDEHTELAWLVTRCLWGDLQDDVTEGEAASCEELARALRRRLATAHPATVRTISLFSRLSLRNPYSPALGDLLGRRGKALEEATDEPEEQGDRDLEPV